MPAENNARILKHIELFAYLLAGWSFLVLYLEPIIGYYLDYKSIELGTALANIMLLSLTLLNRVLRGEVSQGRTIVYFDLLMLITGALLLAYQAKFVIFFLLIRQTYFILQFIIFRAYEGRFYKLLTDNPPISLMLSFAGVILFGTVMLMLPAASAKGQVTHFVDALFTACSATCVTGLVVVDTGTYYSLFGQLIILALIQVGGLGIMTISTAFALILGQRITLKLENVMQSVVGETKVLNLFNLLRNIVLVTIIIESLGAMVLYINFSQVLPPGQALYHSVFHSVSAFCNAGFALWSNSMMSFAEKPVMNLGISFLIILGGLGFTVLIDVYRYVFAPQKIRKLTLHTKLVLVTTLGLIVLGFFAIYIGEAKASMTGFSVYQRIMGSWFQSVTLRTAGFNTVDISKFGPATVLVSLFLMFVGASPGSTGGGIKTTTFSVLVLSVISMLTGKRDLTIFNRKIALSNAREATSLATLSASIVFSIVFVIMLIEPFTFQKIIFEAISAFGTVGLSMGITGNLSYPGKLLITLLMYIGRIGPLTMIYAFSLRKKQVNIDFAEEKIAIG
jgi:trk system potassium uptake protein TrkH